MKLLMENWRSYLSEDWRTETDWEKGEEKITLGDVDNYLGDETDNINVSELSQQIPSLPTRGAKRVNDAKFGEYKIDDETGEEKWVWFPIIVVKSGGQYKYVLDGNHRLQQAIERPEVKTIKAKILDLSDEETPEIFVRMFGGAE